MGAVTCWKCADTGRYRVLRWDWLEGGRIVLKRCDCGAKEPEMTEGKGLNSSESGRTLGAAVLWHCGSEKSAPEAVDAAPGTSPHIDTLQEVRQ